MVDKYIMNPIKNFILGLIVKYFNSVETIKEFDLKWFYKINHFKYRNSTLNSFMLAMTQLGEAWLPLILVILGQQYLGIHVEVVQKIIWSFAISGLITQIIKHAMDRERPTKLEDAIIVGPAPGNQSFPSGHTTSAFSYCIMIGLIIPQMFPVMLILACLAGISRIYLGVHWPSDVIIGSIIGSITSLIVYLF